MAVYVVTGKLGGGKTLACIDKINDALGSGRKVATNLDLRLERLPSCSRTTRSARVLRLPDKPSVTDIESIGYGIEGISSDSEANAAYDESKFGVLVLDECGTWFNSRDWQESGRRELINYLLHIRKRLWDVYLIIQDISMLDKQARKSIAEHVVYCRRTDRMNVPIFGVIYSLFSGGARLPVPKWHIAHVKYGDQQHSLTVDRWMYNGSGLYDAYDTTQVFSDSYSSGVYSLLPPWYQYRRTLTKWNLRNYMRLTHIYLRKYSLVSLSGGFLVTGGLMGFLLAPDHNQAEYKNQEKTSAQSEIINDSKPIIPEYSFNNKTQTPLYAYEIDSSAEYVTNHGTIREFEFTNGTSTYDANQMRAMGITVEPINGCTVKLTQGNESITVRC